MNNLVTPKPTEEDVSHVWQWFQRRAARATRKPSAEASALAEAAARIFAAVADAAWGRSK